MPLKAGYIVPHPPLAVAEVGRGEEAKISATLEAYHEVARRIAGHKPEILVFISPHSAYYSDWVYIGSGEGARGDFGQFGARRVSFSLDYDARLRDAIIAEAKTAGVPAGLVSKNPRELDHGLLVPLYFIDQELSADSYLAVSIGGSGLPRDVLAAFGGCLARACAACAETAVLVASGDLSHKLTKDGPYGFDPAGPVFDAAFGDAVTAGLPLRFREIDPTVCEDAAECGLSGFTMLAAALDETVRLEGAGFSSELLSLEGPFGVGYGIAAFERSG
ncbi:MAG: AmmeMemoRadiSam system protein A, partial [Eggerthellaceae bacterium]|nr:AmmeMemoRadiSam system protein A [Eggerthellaceae bacterium]